MAIFPLGARPDQDGMVSGAQTVAYRQLDLARGDPKALARYLERAFTTCAHAKPTTVNGLTGLTGQAPSEAGFSTPAHYVLLITDRRVTWVVLDGTGWKPAERAHALRVVTDHLKVTKPA